jgi:CDP-diacylglycerol--serine O-phosphatidyltransferase
MPDIIPDSLRIRLIRVIVPNAITVGAILAGYVSMLETFAGEYVAAAAFIIAASVLDMLDGRIARAMNATSEFGVEFDSLADLVNYGVAPALLFYFLYFEDWGLVGIILSFLPVCCAAIRLARFNVTSDPDIPTRYFIGLPTTVAALVLAGFVIFTNSLPYAYDSSHEAGLLTVATALLMVSNVQFEKSNILSLRYIRKTRRIITGIVIVVSMILLPQTAFFAWGLLYIIYGVSRSAYRTFLRGNDDDVEAIIDEEYEQAL